MTISSTAPAHVRSPYRRETLSPRARYQHVLNALSTLCDACALTPRLTTIAFPSPSSSSGGGEEDLELSAAYLHALLAAIKRALAGKVDDVAGYADSLVPVLYGLCVLCTCGAT
ncbi:hypothetical protein B0H13DRAFT_2030657, partial [Mycena leptocephala]